MSHSLGIPQQMKALRLTDYKQHYRLCDIPVPTPGPNDLLVKVAAAGFCHTDYQVYSGTYNSVCPLTPSHEPVGTIVMIGAEVQDQQKWHVGQRVGILNFRHACGLCAGCRWSTKKQGNLDARFCKRKDMAGIKTDGGFAEYIVADPATTVPLPDSVDFDQAAPLMCAGGGLKQAAIAEGDSVAIVGIGGLGALGIQFAKALGYRTVAIDNRKEGLDLAGELPLSPDLIVDFNDPGASEKTMAFTDHLGLEAVVVCTDDIAANEWSLNIIQPAGTCVVLGLPEEGFHFDAFALVFKEISVKGSLLTDSRSAHQMMEVVDKHNIRSHVSLLSLEDAQNIPDRYMRPDLKGRLVVTL